MIAQRHKRASGRDIVPNPRNARPLYPFAPVAVPCPDLDHSTRRAPPDLVYRLVCRLGRGHYDGAANDAATSTFWPDTLSESVRLRVAVSVVLMWPIVTVDVDSRWVLG